MMPTQIESRFVRCAPTRCRRRLRRWLKYGFDADGIASVSRREDRAQAWSRAKADKEPKKESKAKADASKADKPKRGKTGYLLYADEVRAEVKADLEGELGEDEKLKPQDVVKAIAARWKAEDQDVRDDWNARAKTPATSDDEPEMSEAAKAGHAAAEAANAADHYAWLQAKANAEAKPKAAAKPKAEAKSKVEAKPKAEAKKKAKQPEPASQSEPEADSDED